MHAEHPPPTRPAKIVRFIMNRVFQQSYHIPGTLSADINIRFTAPFNCTLKHVSAVASNDSDATLAVGTSADSDGFLTAFAIGDSNTPVEKEAISDFAGALAGSQYSRYSAARSGYLPKPGERGHRWWRWRDCPASLAGFDR